MSWDSGFTGTTGVSFFISGFETGFGLVIGVFLGVDVDLAVVVFLAATAGFVFTAFFAGFTADLTDFTGLEAVAFLGLAALVVAAFFLLFGDFFTDLVFFFIVSPLLSTNCKPITRI